MYGGTVPQPHWGILEYLVAAGQLKENIWWVTITTLIIVDIATGMVKSLFPKSKIKTNSTTGLLGFAKNFTVWAVFSALYPISIAWGLSDYTNIFLLFLIGIYGLSIIENFGVMGFKFPQWLVDRLQKLTDIDENGGENHEKK